MKKLVLWMYVCLMSALLIMNPSQANESASLVTEAAVMRYINNIYAQLDFCENNRLSYDVFVKACHGYLNLKDAGKLGSDDNILTVCDFTRSSNDNRMWVIDMAQKKVLFNTYVAHGQGSGEEFASSFSNAEGSHQSSLGFYVTGDTYEGEHGTSLRLNGVDQSFNDAAFDRGIVVHGADYVSSNFIKGNERLGRSWGCPAVPSKLSLPIINAIKDGSCLFIYYPDKNYLKTAYWLNKRVDRSPMDAIAGDDMAFASSMKPVKKRDTVIVYSFIDSHNQEKTIQAKDLPVLKLPLQ